MIRTIQKCIGKKVVTIQKPNAKRCKEQPGTFLISYKRTMQIQCVFQFFPFTPQENSRLLTHKFMPCVVKQLCIYKNKCT